MGKEFISKLTFIKQTVVGWRKRSTNERVLSKAMYRCECGVEKEFVTSEVNRGKVRSCGCLRLGINTKHGIWNTPLYNIWMDIKNRCYKKRHKAYKYYGERGVRMCDEWLNNVTAFANWCLAHGWEHGLQVDKDIKGDGLLYSPETCSIVTCKVNQNNRRSSKFITFNKETKTVSQWAESVNMKTATFASRIDNGWSMEDALFKPLQKVKI